MKLVASTFLTAFLFTTGAFAANKPPYACVEARDAVLEGEKFDLNISFSKNREALDRVTTLYAKKFGIEDENEVDFDEAVAVYVGPSVVGYVFSMTDFADNGTIVYTFDSEYNLLQSSWQNETFKTEWFCEGY